VGDYGLAKQSLDDALSAVLSAQPTDNARQKNILTVSAMIESDHKKYESGSRYHEETITLARIFYGDEHVLVADLLSQHAQLVAYQRKRPVRAIELLLAWLPLAQTHYGEFGSAIEELRTLGRLQIEQAKFNDAAKHFCRVPHRMQMLHLFDRATRSAILRCQPLFPPTS